jgi:hypothetical protein
MKPRNRSACRRPPVSWCLKGIQSCSCLAFFRARFRAKAALTLRFSPGLR